LDESAADLRDVIDGAVALLAPQAIAKGLQLRVCIERSVAACVLADRTRVGQIVFALLHRAVELAETGRITITARSESLNAGSQRIFIGASETRAATPHDGHDGHDAAIRSTAVEAPMLPTNEPHHRDLTLCRLLARRMGGDVTVIHGAAFGLCAAFDAPFTVERHSRLPVGSERRKAVVELGAQDDRLALCDLLEKLGVSIVPPGLPVPAHVDLWFADRCSLLPATCRATRFISVTDTFITGGLREARGHFELSINPLSWSAVQRACDVRGGERATGSPSVRMRPAAVRKQRSVLVVDDNEINRRVVARQLDVLGHRSVVAATADEALAALSRQCFDLLITDLHMPGMSGIELARRVRMAYRAATNRIPVVLMTAQAEACSVDAIQDRPFDAMLLKPASIDALETCLRPLLAEPFFAAAARAGTESAEPLDCAHLDALSEQGVDVRGLLRDWRCSMNDDLARLQDCRDRRDIDGMRASLHRLGGAVGLVGAGALMDALQRASTAQPEADTPLLDRLVVRARALMAQLDEAAAHGHHSAAARGP
ncbi:MAG TPA: response regulator, partial [Paraburkholderia sp.]